MAGNKTRVQVRGTIGKSVLFPTAATVGAAILGVNVQLPNGTVPTLAQLAAALAGTNTGNIIPPGGSPVVIFQNIQNVPASVLNPARFVPPEEDDGEDTYHRAVPGPQGQRGATGFSVNLTPDDAEDASIVPGPQGARGLPGISLVMNLPSEDPDDAPIVPGPQGIQGIQGVPGAGGTSNTGPQLWIPQDESEEAPQFAIPGGVGPRGLQGFPIPLCSDDVDDVLQIPGPVGPQGIQGLPGAGSAGTGPVRIIFDEEPEEFIHFQSTLPGAAGVSSVTGTANQVSAAPTTGAVVLSLPVAVIFPGAATLNGASSSPLSLNATSGFVGIAFAEAGVTKWQITEGLGTSGRLSFFSNTTGAEQVGISAAGNMALALPTSGDALTINQVTGSLGLRVVSTAATAAITARNNTSGFQLEMGTTAAGAYIDASNTGLILSTQGSANPRLTIGTSGNVVVNAATSGVTMTVGGTTTGFTNATIGALNIAVGQVFSANSAEIFPVSGANLNIGTAVASTTTTIWVSGKNVITMAATGAVSIAAVVGATQLTVTGTANSFAQQITGSGTSGQSFGLQVNAGTTTADLGFQVNNQANTVTYLTVRGDGIVIAAHSPLSPGITQVSTGLAVRLASAVSFTSNTTLAAIPTLGVTCNEAGVYAFEAYLSITEVTTGVGGFKFDLGASTATLTNISLTAIGSGITTGPAFTTTTTVTAMTTVATSTVAPTWVLVKGTIQVTVAGLVEFRGAQNTSSANATSVNIGSYMRLTKIA